MNLKKWIGIGVVAVLAIICIVLAVRVAGLIPQVQLEMTMTPSPSPVFGNTMMVTPVPGAVTAAPVLKNGSAGEEVLRAQQRLKELGYDPGALDGQYGSGTSAAVKAFQELNHLDADGKIGAATLAVLYSEDAIPAPTPVPTAVPTATPVPTSAEVEESISMDAPYVRADGLPLLVNKTIPLPKGYKTYDLVLMNKYCDSKVVKIKYDGTYAEREAVDALMIMLRAAINDGIADWQISAAYRDEAYQKRLFDRQVDTYMKENGLSKDKAITATKKTVAEPGTSEHHIGTCFDITVPGVSFAGTKQAKWLAANCWDYGFILRYTKEKEKITGFLAEAWHFRWVGKEHAQIMHRENLCLEEYLEKYGND